MSHTFKHPWHGGSAKIYEVGYVALDLRCGIGDDFELDMPSDV